MAKPSDVPTYVEYGAADIGVVGKANSNDVFIAIFYKILIISDF